MENMSETLKNLSFSDVLAGYEGRGAESQFVIDIEKEELGIEDLEAFREQVCGAMKRAALAAESVDYGVVSMDVVDDSVPLTLFLFKKDHPCIVNIDLVEGAGEGEKSDRFWEYCSGPSQQVGRMGTVLIWPQQLMNITDRYVDPRFRGQGVGSVLLEGVEGMLEEIATNRQEDWTLLIETGKLDTLCWAWRNGYEPEEEQDRVLLERILCADKGLCLGQDLCVFSDDVPVEKRTLRGHFDMCKVRLVKEVEAEEIGGVEGLVRGVKGVLRRIV